MVMMELGVGLIRIGREWGHVRQDVPSERDSIRFLEHAIAAGIHFYDTAPSYGSSEERTGKFLQSLSVEDRGRITVATKFGEHWDAAREEPYVDHSLDALKRSLDQSLLRLGRIEVLQLHKTTRAVLATDDLARAWDYARSVGIERIGPSVSDLESAEAAIEDPRFSCIQLPLSKVNTKFEAFADRAAARGMFIITNRPFAMGAMLYGETPVARDEAFAYLLARAFDGVVLTGTGRIEHLDENLAAFRQAADHLAGARSASEIGRR